MVRLSITWAALFVASAFAATPAQWRSQSIYQLITDRFARTDGSTTAPCDPAARKYCGGTYRGIINQLDYIQGMGFTAIWISPITYNIEGSTGEGEAYHGYWQQDLYALNENFGTAADLVALSSALHARGMLLMVDVVVNHLGWVGLDVDYSKLHPFNDKKYYNPYCGRADRTNQTVLEICWLGNEIVSLPDLKLESVEVRDELSSWLGSLVSNYSVDGIRFDAAKHVNKTYWPEFNAATGVFNFGEIYVHDPIFLHDYTKVLDGVLNYPTYFTLVEAFNATENDLTTLINQINGMKNDYNDPSLLGSFSENHDNPRFPSYTPDTSLAKNVIAFTVLGDGIPIIYNGQEQHFAGGQDPANREAVWLSGYDTTSEFYKHITTLNKVRTFAIDKNSTYLSYHNYVFYSDNTTMAMRKGFDGNQIVTVLSNLGSGGAEYVLTLNGTKTGFSAGEEVVDVLSCTAMKAEKNGDVGVLMMEGLPRVLYPAAKLSGSGICESNG